jgi:hypothetical protein
MTRPVWKANLLTAVLVLATVCGLVLLVHRLWQGTQTARLLATEPKPFGVPELDIDIPARAASLAVIQDQALFYASRHLYTPPPPSAVPSTPPRPDYKLAGTFIIPSKPTVALLTGSAGVSRKVKTGDELDGWTVQSIEAGRVTLQSGDTKFDIVSATKAGNAGMHLVPLSQTAQTAQATQAAQTGVIRSLGAASQGAPISRSNYPIPNASPRLYRPPPK